MGQPPTEGRADVVSIAFGSTVWEQAPEGADYQPRGGLVVNVKVDEETGEQTAVVLQARKRGRKIECYTVDLDASCLNRDAIEAPEPYRCFQAARTICAYLGQRNTAVNGFDRWLLETAMGLCLIADDLIAATVAAVKERTRSLYEQKEAS